MTTERIEALLADILNDDEAQTMLPLDGLRTFKEAGILTNSNGLVIRTTDGSEFQITIVKSI